MNSPFKLRLLTDFLRKSLDDRRLTHAERTTLAALLADEPLEARERDVLFHKIIELAKEALTDPRDRAVLAWLSAVIRVARPTEPAGATGTHVAESWFLPDDRAIRRLTNLLDRSAKTLDICVFTITHNTLAEAVLAAHVRGVTVRLLTDDAKTEDLGSDIAWLGECGVPVRTDNSLAHMHHKFAVIDGRLLVSGSFNWTRSAADENQENFVVTDDPALVRAFADEFARLWEKFGPR